MRAITTSEGERREYLERIVTKGKKAFIEVGNALREIRDSKLYRSTHNTFAAYVEDRFGFKRANAYHLIEAADAAGSLSNMSDKITNSRQLAEVAKAPAEKRDLVVELAHDIASERGKQPTAAIIAEAREACCSGGKAPEQPTRARKNLPEFVSAFRRCDQKAAGLRVFFEELDPCLKVLLQEWLNAEFSNE